MPTHSITGQSGTKEFGHEIKSLITRYMPFATAMYRVIRRVFTRKTVDEKWCQLLTRLGVATSDVFFVEVGANDGVSFDPLHTYIIRHRWRGLLVEPLPDLFRQLKETYKQCTGLIFENMAIAEKPGCRDMYRIATDVLTNGTLPAWTKGIASFFNDRNALGGYRIPASTFEQIRSHITVEKVMCDTLDNLLRKHAITKIDVLQIDVEGYDYHVLRQVDFSRFRPSIIRIEWLNLPDDEKGLAIQLLRSQGYHIRLSPIDLIAWHTRGLIPNLIHAAVHLSRGALNGGIVKTEPSTITAVTPEITHLDCERIEVASQEESNLATESRKPHASTILLLCSSAAVAFLLGETAFQFAVPHGYYVWPPGLKQVFMPPEDIMPGISGPSRFVANSLGIRGDEFKTSDAYRILAIGGSTTECLYLDQSETWPLLLQKYLNGTAMYHNVWVGNAGMSGKTTRHHITAMKYLPLLDMRIDMIILLIGVNDFVIRLAQHEQYDSQFTMKSGSGQILIDETFAGGSPYWDAPFFKKTALWYIGHKAKGMITDTIRGNNVAHNNVQDEFGKMYVRLRQHRQDAIEIRDELPDLSSAIEEYKRNVHTMIDIAQEKSIRLVFVTQPTMWKADLPDQLDRLLWLGGIGDFMKQTNRPYYSVQALDKGMRTYNDALLKVCEERRVECLDLSSLLEKDLTVFYDDVHFNESGAEKVANAVAKYMVNREFAMQ